VCSAGAQQCSGNAVQTCSASGTWGTATPCDPTTPVCTGAGICGDPPSCDGLAKTCGSSGTEDCCSSNEVPGITSATFYRSYDGVTSGYTSMAYPAEVSDFWLDNYEITVGRFRKFAAAYSQTMIAAGAGKNPNNPNDTGWDATDWNTSLDASASALEASLGLCAPYSTWTTNQGNATAESLPITCLNWFEAEAFCIWDAGRLPTEAEWNYAAAGGTEQRLYPWVARHPGPIRTLRCGAATMAAAGIALGSRTSLRWVRFRRAMASMVNQTWPEARPNGYRIGM
jgi:sulfatase modifying factor 1